VMVISFTTVFIVMLFSFVWNGVNGKANGRT